MMKRFNLTMAFVNLALAAVQVGRILQGPPAEMLIVRYILLLVTCSAAALCLISLAEDA